MFKIDVNIQVVTESSSASQNTNVSDEGEKRDDSKEVSPEKPRKRFSKALALCEKIFVSFVSQGVIELFSNLTDFMNT